MKPAFVWTFSGKKVDVINPNPDDITLEDIAQGLSNMSRWNGQCRKFASVAEHSVAVSYLTKDLAGLMHDASEAYIADIVKTVKPHLTNYYAIEDGLMKVIAKKFDFPYPFVAKVKKADLQQLSTEAHYLTSSKGDHFDWETYAPQGRPSVLKGIRPRSWPPKKAKEMFLARFKELTT